MKSVVTRIPHFWNAMGSVRTPPPSIVAMRLNEPTRRLDGRLLIVSVAVLLEEKGGTR